jgi:TFIIF-interacting CTD phosphatase-like protein
LSRRIPSDSPRLLPEVGEEDRGKKCLVLDLDGTLIYQHRSKERKDADIYLEIMNPSLVRKMSNNATRLLDSELMHSSCGFLQAKEQWYEGETYLIMKRPGVDDFLLEMAKYFEVVLYTSSFTHQANTSMRTKYSNNWMQIM